VCGCVCGVGVCGVCVCVCVCVDGFTVAQDSYHRQAISVTNVDFNENRRFLFRLVPFTVPLLQTSLLYYP